MCRVRAQLKEYGACESELSSPTSVCCRGAFDGGNIALGNIRIRQQQLRLLVAQLRKESITSRRLSIKT